MGTTSDFSQQIKALSREELEQLAIALDGHLTRVLVVIDLIGECPIHGKGCTAYALQWVEKVNTLPVVPQLVKLDDGWYWTTGETHE